MGGLGMYDALIERANASEPRDGTTAARAIRAPYDKNLYEIMYPGRPWPPRDEDAA